MSGKTTRDAVPNFTDPETLRDREDIESRDATIVHDDRDHRAIDAEGKAVVGVTDEDGRTLLLVDYDRPFAVLFNGVVESGDDWADVGRQQVEHMTDLPVEIDGIERVRRVEHRTESEDEPHTTSYHVVFSASPATDDLTISHGCDWRGEWCHELPVEVEEELAEEDIRLFVD